MDEPITNMKEWRNAAEHYWYITNSEISSDVFDIKINTTPSNLFSEVDRYITYKFKTDIVNSLYQELILPFMNLPISEKYSINGEFEQVIFQNGFIFPIVMRIDLSETFDNCTLFSIYCIINDKYFYLDINVSNLDYQIINIVIKRDNIILDEIFFNLDF